MSRTQFLTVLTVLARSLAGAAVLSAVLVAVPAGAQARPATSACAWGESNPALGGTSLAVYVAHHHQRALGHLGV
ncbi:MAG: hypothetical protein ABIQ59_06550 [Nocardioidaceae bacterium]